MTHPIRAVLLITVVVLAPLAGGAALRAAPEKPALVVVISIDQFRGDYLPRFREHFGPGGFNLLLENGAVFVDCHHRHSVTKTAPGHAAMLTGVHADINGIIANDWLDRGTFERVSCVGDDSVQIVGLPPPPRLQVPGVAGAWLGRSPRNLLVPTVGDELKLSRGGRPKVIGIAGKDRAAILMTGRLADAAYFMVNARMVSSTYYMRTLPAWVEAWNGAGKVEAWFGKTWERLLPEAAYAVQGPDDAEGEDVNAGRLGRTFPKIVDGGATSPDGAFFNAFGNTPFANDVLEDFAEVAIESENLGGRAGVTDLLCLGFSATDHAGHLWGPDSHEVMDMVLRMDRTLERFFGFLDRRVGLGRCLIVLTADHGAPSMPERIHAMNTSVPAGRVDGALVLSTAEEAMDRAFGPLAGDKRWLARDDASLLLLPAALEEKQIEPAAAQAVARDALLALDFVQAAYTRDQLERGEVIDEPGRQAMLSFNRERSGDVFYQAKPFFFERATGTNHGTPYNYDTHVPLVFFGPGVKAGAHAERVGVSDLAPTLSRLLGISAPPHARGRVLF